MTTIIPQTSSIEDRSAEANRRMSSICWTTTAIILIFMCVMHLGVLLTFIANTQLLSLVTPGALILSVAAGYWLSRRESLQGWQLMVPSAVFLAFLGFSMLFAASFFDLSWDGLWYHQTAVYQMMDGWNPLSDPMREFTPHLQDWVRHYAKGSWYVALALYKTTGNIEWAKITPLLTLVVMFLAVFAASIDVGMRRRSALLIATLVSLNPVVIFELASYLVDGIMIALLACFIAAMVRWIKRPDLIILLIALMAAILCINAKFTGLVYICFFMAAGGIYILIRQRNRFWRYAVIQFTAILLGTLVFGYNPYVTNTIHRGNPFYPLLGTSTYPSHAQQGEDAIENVETPKNMMGRNRFVRLGYAIFGRPAAYPYPRDNALLMWPFNVSWQDFAMYYFHDVRISGFGPLFSGALLLSLFLLGAALYKPGSPRLIVLLLWGVSAASLLVSVHTWWARYGPQLWWLPVAAVIAGLSAPDRQHIRLAAWCLSVLLIVNVVIIEAVHYHWEINATHTTYEQMAMLREMGEVDIDLRYFGEPFGRRLSTAGVTYNDVGLGGLRDQPTMELMSVSHGYWGAVLIRIPEGETGMLR